MKVRSWNPVLFNAVGARPLGINDNAQFVVDQVIGVIGEEGPHLLLRHPGGLRIGQRDRLGRLAPPATFPTSGAL